jgi:ribosomal subunit interface protein
MNPTRKVSHQIQTQHVALQPEWRALIEERLARLAERYPELMHVHVTLRHDRHHRSGVEEVDVLATCAGITLRAAKQEEKMRDAIHAALDALERELAAHHEARRHKARGTQLPGTMAL